MAENSYLLTVERIVEMHKQMNKKELEALRAWEKENLPNKNLGTTDWPGWPAVVRRLQN